MLIVVDALVCVQNVGGSRSKKKKGKKDEGEPAMASWCWFRLTMLVMCGACAGKNKDGKDKDAGKEGAKDAAASKDSAKDASSGKDKESKEVVKADGGKGDAKEDAAAADEKADDAPFSLDPFHEEVGQAVRVSFADLSLPFALAPRDCVAAHRYLLGKSAIACVRGVARCADCPQMLTAASADFSCSAL